MVNWDSIGGFDRFPKLSEELKAVGDTRTVIFQDDGKDVSADILQTALKAKGQKGIKARDSIVFAVKCNQKDYEVWLSATSYSNLRELKQIRDSSNGTLKGAKVKISRVSKDDMSIAAFKYESA